MTPTEGLRMPITDLWSYKRLRLHTEVVGEHPGPGPELTSPRRVADLCSSLAFADSESVWWLGLDTKKELVACAPIGLGSVDACMCPAREFVRLSLLAASVAGAIVVHNHPSGNPEPSESDLETFQELEQAMRLVGLELIDAVIVARDGYWSRLDNSVVRERRYPVVAPCDFVDVLPRAAEARAAEAGAMRAAPLTALRATAGPPNAGSSSLSSSKTGDEHRDSGAGAPA